MSGFGSTQFQVTRCFTACSLRSYISIYVYRLSFSAAADLESALRHSQLYYIDAILKIRALAMTDRPLVFVVVQSTV